MRTKIAQRAQTLTGLALFLLGLILSACSNGGSNGGY
jgi:hypothetical protein